MTTKKPPLSRLLEKVRAEREGKPAKPKPVVHAEMPFYYVEFDRHQGVPTKRTGVVSVVDKGVNNFRRLIKFEPGVTGHESYYLDGFVSNLEEYKLSGLWPCAGTQGRWNAMYVHGWQVAKIAKDLDLETLAQ